MQPLSPQTEKQADEMLVILAQKGDELAFTELVRRHETSCAKLAYSILRDKSDAEDEVQNATWKAFQHIRQFHLDSKFSTWLNRIVVNQCLMRLRQLRRARFLYLDDTKVGEETGTLELRDMRTGPEQELGQSELAQVVQREIKRIPPLLRNVFLLHEVEKREMPEVARQLGISISAAKSRLLRARIELRSRMEKHLGQKGAATLIA